MNLFEAAFPETGERFEILHRCGDLEIVRILSTSLDGPKEFCDERDEWVVLMRGAATLVIEGRELHLRAGDTLFIPANTPHTLQVSPQVLCGSLSTTTLKGADDAIFWSFGGEHAFDEG